MKTASLEDDAIQSDEPPMQWKSLANLLPRPAEPDAKRARTDEGGPPCRHRRCRLWLLHGSGFGLQ